MARYKHYDYSQMMMVPVSLKGQLMPGTLEYGSVHLAREGQGKYTMDTLLPGLQY